MSLNNNAQEWYKYGMDQIGVSNQDAVDAFFKARDLWRQALRYDPRNATYLNNDARCNILLYRISSDCDIGFVRKAEENLKEAISIDNQSDAFWKNLGDCYYEYGDYSQAFEFYNLATELNSDSPAWVGKSNYYFIKFKEADDKGWNQSASNHLSNMKICLSNYESSTALVITISDTYYQRGLDIYQRQYYNTGRELLHRGIEFKSWKCASYLAAVSLDNKEYPNANIYLSLAVRLGGSDDQNVRDMIDAYNSAVKKSKKISIAKELGKGVAKEAATTLAGAEIGAALGSVVPGLGTLIGAGVGGFVGKVYGMLKKKK